MCVCVCVCVCVSDFVCVFVLKAHLPIIPTNIFFYNHSCRERVREGKERTKKEEKKQGRKEDNKKTQAKKESSKHARNRLERSIKIRERGTLGRQTDTERGAH